MATGRVPTTANSPLTAKGDLFTYSTAPARLAVGNNGESLVADSAATTGLRWQGSAISKNGVFNSGYDVFQRTSTPTTGVTTAGGIAYTIDRWMSWTQSAGGSCVTSQQATGDTTNLPFVRYCARFRRATSNTDTGNLVFGQSIENTDSARFIGQKVTFSFYARKGANYSATSNTLFAVVWANTTTDAALNSVTSGENSVSITATLTSNWQRFQGTGTVTATNTQLAFGFFYSPTGTAGAADYFEVTGVQLELGSIATPFAKMGSGTIQEELAACQRYYFRTNWQALTAYAIFGTGAGNSATQIRTDNPFPVSMRVNPTAIDFPAIGTYFTLIKYDDTTAGTVSAVALDSNLTTTTIGRLNWTVTVGVANTPFYARGANSTAAYLGWSAEL